MVLCFTSRADRLTCALYTAYCFAASWLFIASLRDGTARGLRWFRNKFLIAFALGLALSIIIGVIVHVGIDYAVNEYIQSH